jgi:glucosamine 6-phosphate synthetase-like amidotransferase/phosphosugar isomerase protein
VPQYQNKTAFQFLLRCSVSLNKAVMTLLAKNVALVIATDVDKPLNLAKSVSVTVDP